MATPTELKKMAMGISSSNLFLYLNVYLEKKNKVMSNSFQYHFPLPPSPKWKNFFSVYLQQYVLEMET